MASASELWDAVSRRKHGNKLGPKATAAVDTNETTEAAIRERVGKEEQQRALDIIAACDAAGAPNRAAELIASGKSVSEVIAALGSGRARPRG